MRTSEGSVIAFLPQVPHSSASKKKPDATNFPKASGNFMCKNPLFPGKRNRRGITTFHLIGDFQIRRWVLNPGGPSSLPMLRSRSGVSISTRWPGRPALAGHWPWLLFRLGPGRGRVAHKQHSIPPINSVCHLQCASSTPKIPSTNLLFQSHPPNTEDACSLILLQCIREARQRGPPRPSPGAFMQYPPDRTVCRDVGGEAHEW
jgi:hypothetical protein